MKNMTEPVGLMEPMLPPEGRADLSDLVADLITKSNRVSGKLNPIVMRSIGALVRSMNCYYSNLIEGHNTHPKDIDRALANHYAQEPKKRALQKEAVAHITVQKMIDMGEAPDYYPLSSHYAQWVHEAFCTRLPEELRWVQNPHTEEKIKISPGLLRDGTVIVGRHIPPQPHNLAAFLARFDQAYAPDNHSTIERIISVAAAHHRFLWIHPFYDGNGRVARLMSYAALQRLGVGSDLWSVARGFARHVDQYKSLLQAADARRQGDLDGRGTLSQKALIAFCAFFLNTCSDQVAYMDSLLDFQSLSERMRIYVEEEIAFKNLPKGSYTLLREALLVGEFERGRAAEITGYKERAARNVLTSLVKKGMLVSDTPRSAVRLGFPVELIERWFPLLYPSTSSP
jgi:Fic family protein